MCANLIEQLNRRYASEGQGTFFLFHRNRTFNSIEKVWMGWERKRGKLLDLNNLLLGKNNNFSMIAGDQSQLLRNQVRHHARRRHPVAARLRAANWWERSPTRCSAR